ncbi:coil containing protein [Vibrio phage 1.170.O._10N.261.52.C3]|nr:coil containing protein [Vibrio phage 1.170.O._10N.261.52.C3]
MKNQIAEIKTLIDQKTIEVEKLTKHIVDYQRKLENMQHDPMAYFEDEITESYHAMLNECYVQDINLPWSIGCIGESFKENDPVSYRCGLNDHSDRWDVSQYSDCQEIEEEISDLEYVIEDLGSEIEDLEEEIEELENED